MHAPNESQFSANMQRFRPGSKRVRSASGVVVRQKDASRVACVILVMTFEHEKLIQNVLTQMILQMVLT